MLSVVHHLESENSSAMKPPCSTALLVVLVIICDVCPTSCMDATLSSTTSITSSMRQVQPEPDRDKSSMESTMASITSASSMLVAQSTSVLSSSYPPSTSGTPVTQLSKSSQLDSDVAAVHIKFNCMRPHTTCVGSSSVCSNKNFRCQCEQGRQGYDCSLMNDTIVAKCNPPCQNGGTCYSKVNDSTQTMCYCGEAFYGDRCEQERVYHKCNPDSVEMHVAPIVGCNDVFLGSIYVKGHEDDDRCVFKRSTNTGHNSSSASFANTILFSDCGMAENSTDVTIGMTSLSWRIVVRYDDVLLDTDQELTFTCYLRQPGNTYEWHAWMISNDNMINSQLPSRSVASEVQPVLMSLETQDGRPVIGPQQLGTTLVLKYTLNGGNVYDSFRIEKITASNSLPGAKRHVFNLVNNSCVTFDAQRTKKVVQSLERRNSTEVVLKFKVFKLRFSNQLIFENVIKACRTSVDCQPVDCNNVTSQQRKKRSANETDDRPMSVTSDNTQSDVIYNKANASLTVMYVIDEPNESDVDCHKVASWPTQDADNQLHNTAFIVVAIVLIVAVVIAVSLIVSVVYLRLLRKQWLLAK